MSSVGFSLSSDKELEQLREAYDSLKDVVREIESAVVAIDSLNFGMVKGPLKGSKVGVSEPKENLRFSMVTTTISCAFSSMTRNPSGCRL